MLIQEKADLAKLDITDTELAFDFETTDLHHKKLSIEGLALAGDVTKPLYIPFDNTNISMNDLHSFSKDLFSRDILFIGHNLIFDLKIVKYFFDVWPEKYFDIMVAAWYIDENKPKDLKTLATELLGIEMIQYKDVAKNRGEVEGYKEFVEYAKRDAYTTYELYKLFKPQLEKIKNLYVFQELEMPFIEVIVNMTLAGIDVDKSHLQHIAEILEVEAEGLQQQIYTKFGEEFNINSPQQLSEKLYGIKVSRKNKQITLERIDDTKPMPTMYTKKGAPSTSEKALRKIGTDEAKMIIHFKEMEKQLSTYALGYQKFIIEGKIWPNFFPSGTVTGRLCVHPDTLIEAPRDLVKYPDGIPLHQLKEGDLVYSFDEDRELCLRKVKWVGPTKIKPTLIIHTDKGPPLILSREHLVRKWRGMWVHAKDLKVGDRLLCMPKRGISEGYSYFFPHSRNRGNGSKGGGKVKEHRFVAFRGKQRHSNYLVHHIDENKINNHHSNLEILHGIPSHKIKHSYKGKPELLEKAVRTGYGKTGKKLSKETLRKYKNQLKRNHTITKIEEGPETQLWDLEIEDTHTFIGNDIALHNSSSSPNMQNLPAERENTPIELSAREAFYVPDGYDMIVADESQLELRVLAHFSKDPTLIAAFKAGGDIHTKTASMILGKPPEEIGSDERRFSKTLNFAIIYGMGTQTLSEVLGVPMSKTKELLENYFSTYAGVKTFISEVETYVYKHGYVKTLLKRYRRLPNVYSNDHGLKNGALRQAVNSVIQGSASDILKAAMVKIHNAFKEEELDAKMLLQIHDELVFRVKEKDTPRALEIVKHYMEKPFKVELAVPLLVEPKVCRTWREGK